MSAQPFPKLTFEQYLEMDRAAEFRSEYIKGEVVCMSGGSRNHAFLIARALSLLDQQLGDGPCAVVSSDMRVYSKVEDVGFYPDVLVTCGPDQFYDKRRDVLLDATVIVEVLSPSTRRYDQSEKFEYYRTLPSFREYVLLWQDRVRAQHHVRQLDDSWLLRDLTGPDTVIELNAIKCRLPLAPLYARVKFD